MANPQVENGYTKIANEIVEAIYKYKLSGHECRMLLLIIRKTYGFNKTEDSISLSQMMEALSLSKTRCSQVINKLQLQKIVTVTEYCNGKGKKYRFNKDFEQWNTVTEKCNRYRKVKSTVTVFCNPPLQKSVSTKETITKETITKEKVFVLPSWIPEETWQAYIAVRNKKKAANTTYALNLIIKKLEKFKPKHIEIINQSITGGWVDMYPLKGELNASTNTGFTANTYRGNNNNRELDPRTAAEIDRIAASLK
jgi:phage replication O-like protein O